MENWRSTLQGANIRDFWEWLVSIDTSDADDARLGHLFNTLMVLSVFVAFSLSFSFIVAGLLLGYFEDLFDMWVGATLSGAFIVLSGLCFVMAKRGHLRAVIPWYVWSNYLSILLAVFLFDGFRSPGWLIFFWPVMLAGTLLEPGDAVRMSLGVLVFYGLIYALEALGYYVPPFHFSSDNFRFMSLSYGLTLLVSSAGIVNYLNMQNQNRAFKRLHQTTEALEETQRGLESRVAERTVELQFRVEQLQAIAELSRATSAGLDLQRLLDTTVVLIAERLTYDHVAVFLIDPEDAWVILSSSSSEGGKQMMANGFRLKVGRQGVVGFVAQTSLPRIAFNTGEDAAWFDYPDLPHMKSELALPLIAHGKTIGVLDIQMKRESAFVEDDIKVVHILADSIAAAIINARSLDETREALDRLARYQEEDTFLAWRQALARRNMEIDYVYTSGLVNQIAPGDARIENVDRNISAITTQVTPEGRHLLLTPLRIQDHSVGVFSFERTAPWSDDDVQLTEFVIDQLELALDNARLLEQTRLAARQERARSEIVARVRALSTTDAILRTAAEELGRALKVERSRIQLLPPGDI